MRFLHPEMLWLLFAIPILLYIKGRRGNAASLLFSTTAIFASIARQRRIRPGTLILVLKTLPILLLIIALARPQLGSTTSEVEASGIDILLAVDVSGSMKAMDFTVKGKATDRLEAVKSVVTTFIDARPNDRISLIAFAGKPYLVSPLTLDHNWLKRRLESLSIGMVEDGTAIGSAVGSGVNRLRQQESKSKIVILLTDGMNNRGKLSPLLAAEAAKTHNIKIYTIGAGTKGKAPMPVVDPYGRKQLAMVRVDIDEATLKKVAELTGAHYFRATDTDSLEQIYKEINTLETTTRTIQKFENYQELFPYFVYFALTLMLVSIVINGRRLP